MAGRSMKLEKWPKISGYIASLRKHKDPIPTDDGTLVASLDLEYSR
jgi:hypothetical protein